MKKILLALLLPLLLNACDQPEDYAGLYTYSSDNPPFVSDYNLTLHPDGTFKLTNFEDQECYSYTLEAEGKWVAKANSITFDVNENPNNSESLKSILEDSKPTIENDVIKLKQSYDDLELTKEQNQ